MHIKEDFIPIHTSSPQKKNDKEIIIIYIVSVGDNESPRIAYGFRLSHLQNHIGRSIQIVKLKKKNNKAIFQYHYLIIAKLIMTNKNTNQAL